MNRTIPLSLMLILAPAHALAEFVGAGAVEAGTTVEKVIEERGEDRDVSLTGFLVKQIDDEHYWFKDHTGDMKVEIDEAVFSGTEVTPEMKVRITGEVELDFEEVRIDVGSLQVIDEGLPTRQQPVLGRDRELDI
ncbi:NirD/YgiW/YdeI family stress tolerance protein [Allohahella marinimesophila]|uniref:Bacterial OB-fold domain-containing protein n=1 Tax=Allohahella marinimesophila TaxID=1054972 RepID=A0ABP7P858_9GAMM